MEYWIWLQRALGAGARADDILSCFGSPKAFFDAGRREWILSGVVSHDTAKKLEQTSVEASLTVIEDCRKNGWSILTPASEAYPHLLREISAFPLALYVWGDAAALQAEVPIAFVGTRNASRYGLQVSHGLARGVAGAGALVVSGAALGVDSSSHRGALEAGKQTVAFLGCGLGCTYLKENEALRREIAQNGAVVSEFLPFSTATKATFPIRNRLISGMCLGTVVIEAGVRSGSLITAGCASRQGRDVFAVPGDIITSNHTGANKLIRDGAKPVFSPGDILEEYALLYPRALRPIPAPEKKIAPPGHNCGFSSHIDSEAPQSPPAPVRRALPGDARDALKAVHRLLAEAPKTADTLSEESGLPVAEVLFVLTELEMRGFAAQAEGGAFTAAYAHPATS